MVWELRLQKQIGRTMAAFSYHVFQWNERAAPVLESLDKQTQDFEIADSTRYRYLSGKIRKSARNDVWLAALLTNRKDSRHCQKTTKA